MQEHILRYYWLFRQDLNRIAVDLGRRVIHAYHRLQCDTHDAAIFCANVLAPLADWSNGKRTVLSLCGVLDVENVRMHVPTHKLPILVATSHVHTCKKTTIWLATVLKAGLPAAVTKTRWKNCTKALRYSWASSPNSIQDGHWVALFLWLMDRSKALCTQSIPNLKYKLIFFNALSMMCRWNMAQCCIGQKFPWSLLTTQLMLSIYSLSINGNISYIYNTNQHFPLPAVVNMDILVICELCINRWTTKTVCLRRCFQRLMSRSFVSRTSTIRFACPPAWMTIQIVVFVKYWCTQVVSSKWMEASI